MTTNKDKVRQYLAQPANFKRRKVLCSNSNQPGHLTRLKLCIAYVDPGLRL